MNDAWVKQKDYVRANAKLCKSMLREGEAEGQSVVICGAGPSLATHIDEVLDIVKPDAVWGCNSALAWLHNTGRRVTHGISVAPEDGMLEDWKDCPPVHYYLATCVSPLLVKRLMGRHRKISFFHSFVGLPKPEGWEPPPNAVNHTYDTWFYSLLYPYKRSFMVDGGLNVTNRALGVADAMGFARIVLIGADCCLKPSDDPMPIPSPDATDEEAQALNQEWCSRQGMYADGRDAKAAFGHATLLEGTIAGRRFVSRADMLESAKWLVKSKREMGARLELVGDTLPNWLVHQDPELVDAFLPQISQEGLMTNIGVRK